MLNFSQFKESSNYSLEPSQFASIDPMSCIFKENAREYEVIARNIMVILWRTGDVFRDLSWDEYKKERKKDGNFSEREEYFFNRVKPYCSSSEKAMQFSPNWKDILEKATDKYNL